MSWDSIDEALAVRDPDPSRVALFEAAGFDEERARRGAAMLVSGRYLGFADAATSLLQEGKGAEQVTEETIAAAAARADREAAEQLRTRPSPWGRPPVQEQRTNAFGRLLPPLVKTPTEADFREVGLNVNLVMRWEYRAGSTLFLVYTRSQAEPGDGVASPHRLAPQALAHGPTTDSVLVKWTYYWAR